MKTKRLVRGRNQEIFFMGRVVVLGFELKALQTLKAVVKDRKFKSSLGLKGKKAIAARGQWYGSALKKILLPSLKT